VFGLAQLQEISLRKPRIRCLLADSHPLVRLGMRRLLEDEPDMEIVGEGADAPETIKKSVQHQPDLVLMDGAMPELSPIETVRLIQRSSPRTRVIFLIGDKDSALHGLRAGSLGFVDRNTSVAKLAQAIRDEYRGLRLVSPQVQQQGLLQAAGNPPAALTPREREIVKLLASGNSVRTIAALLGLSAKTVEAHKFNLMRKLDIHNKAQLVTYAIKKKIVEVSSGS
jgi:two-component system, NarL family, response regulator NreC